MFAKHGFSLVQHGFAPQCQAGLMERGADPAAEIKAGMIRQAGASECQWQHLCQCGYLLRIYRSTDPEQNDPGYHQPNPWAGFGESDHRHQIKCPLLVLVEPIENEIVDESVSLCE